MNLCFTINLFIGPNYARLLGTSKRFPASSFEGLVTHIKDGYLRMPTRGVPRKDSSVRYSETGGKESRADLSGLAATSRCNSLQQPDWVKQVGK